MAWTLTGEVSGVLVQTPPYPLMVSEVPAEAVPAAAEILPGRPVTAANLLAHDDAAVTAAWQRPVPRPGYRPIEDRAVVEFS